MRHYDGSRKWVQIENELCRAGFEIEFDTTYDTLSMPRDFIPPRFAKGWEIRRHMTAWCKKHGITEFRIVRNTSFHKDLHGVVYQLWTKGFDRNADYIRQRKNSEDRAMGGE